jgi:hypothetical protein
MTVAAADSTCAWSATSQGYNVIPGRPARASRRSPGKSTATTFHPPAVKRSAASRPMPLAAPVTTATSAIVAADRECHVDFTRADGTAITVGGADSERDDAALGVASLHCARDHRGGSDGVEP